MAKKLAYLIKCSGRPKCIELTDKQTTLQRSTTCEKTRLPRYLPVLCYSIISLARCGMIMQRIDHVPAQRQRSLGPSKLWAKFEPDATTHGRCTYTYVCLLVLMASGNGHNIAVLQVCIHFYNGIWHYCFLANCPCHQQMCCAPTLSVHPPTCSSTGVENA